jgi:hypothetical protein
MAWYLRRKSFSEQVDVTDGLRPLLAAAAATASNRPSVEPPFPPLSIDEHSSADWK